MGRIKSALEIALERTESIQSDKESVGQFEVKQAGKKLANSFLDNPENVKLESEVKNTPKAQQQSLKEGIFEVLISRITLPVSKEDEKRIETVGKGLQSIINDSRFFALYKQLKDLLSRYLGETAQYEEAIKRQYAPRLRQKEEELSKRMGQPVKLDPFQDPEFVALYKQNMDSLKEKYQAAIDQVREEASAAFETSKK
jgi:hypothetical protein